LKTQLIEYKKESREAIPGFLYINLMMIVT